MSNTPRHVLLSATQPAMETIMTAQPTSLPVGHLRTLASDRDLQLARDYLAGNRGAAVGFQMLHDGVASGEITAEKIIELAHAQRAEIDRQDAALMNLLIHGA